MGTGGGGFLTDSAGAVIVGIFEGVEGAGKAGDFAFPEKSDFGIIGGKFGGFLAVLATFVADVA